MSHKYLGFPLVLVTALALAAGSEALPQPPQKKGGGDKFGKGDGPGGKKGGKGGPQNIAVSDMVDRVMSLDKNGDAKVTLDELPERMQYLMTLGDANKDGSLEREEIRTLAMTLEQVTAFAQPNNGPGPKGGGPKGNNLQKALDDVVSPGKTHKQATTLIKGHQDKIRRQTEVAQAELLASLGEVLTAQDYKAFKAAVDNQPGPTFGGDFNTPADQMRRVEQLQKELEELRRRLQK